MQKYVGMSRFKATSKTLKAINFAQKLLKKANINCSRLLEPQKGALDAKSWSKVAQRNVDRPTRHKIPILN